MNKIVLFNTSYGTQNMGDFIINKAIIDEMGYLLNKSFVVEYGTHNPILRFMQCLKRNQISNYCKSAKYKFICGTNILSKSLDHLTPNFNINCYDSHNYADSILIGCGVGNVAERTSFRTRHIYKRVLSNKYMHSVRDEKAKEFVEKLGFKAINTGCPTIWMLNSAFCKEIPKNKADKVVFTLTDYCKDRLSDQFLIDILKKNYKKVYFWIQGSEDLDYLRSLNGINNIELISPNLNAYESILENGNIDYVGTRLHAGIFAMRHKVRSIIMIVDNRTRDMKETYNLVAVERDDMDKLEELINSSFATDVKIDEKKIAEWKAQFK